MSKKIGQSGGAGRWRVCYQRGLPCLVYILYIQQKADESGIRHKQTEIHIVYFLH